MARNNSFIRLEGTLDGLTFYRANGESLVKTQSRISKSRILNDPQFKRTRENMSEFGGAVKAAKSFRSAFAGVVKTMSDTFFGARITSIMKRINASGAGPRGERSFEIADNSELFRGFEFNERTPFNSHFFAPAPDPAINVARDTVTWDVPDFDTDLYVVAPEGATHFKLMLAAGYVSDYDYSVSQKVYEPLNEVVNAIGGFAVSAAIPLGGMVGGVTTLTVDQTALGAIPVTSGLFASVGIVFFQEVNTELYELAQGNAMKVAITG